MDQTLEQLNEAAEAERRYYAWQERAREAQAASPEHRGAYLLDECVDNENAESYPRTSAEYWQTMMSSAQGALHFRCEGAGLSILNVPAE